ncbi:transglutaminase family protein [Aquimarina sp. AU474]|uniref:transglutaminase-like domain-containing protein n=1 Tax=Aquimarina sp. AU474 TaxID=2108529 RepID=UPI000D69FF40|nr:transglutaminase family protein [Aquimarina sp. AU474]
MQKIILPILVVITMFNFVKVSAQEEIDLNSAVIDSVLVKNANAVVRSEEVTIEINSVNSITTKVKKVITVLNKYGDRHADSFEVFDKSRRVKKISAIFYDHTGKEIKKYKKGDFVDRSMINSGELFDDTRILYINYTAVGYPYTMVFESEIENSTTAFIRPWRPVSSNYLSTQRSVYAISNPKKLPLKIKESNFDNYLINNQKEEGIITYSIVNISAKESEVLSPLGDDVFPLVNVALTNFVLEGVHGSALDWKSLGKWMYEELLKDRDQLPQETIDEVNKLVKGAKSKREKAKLIYEYVQEKTRYISVQLGIGGWMPFLASDVDRLGYGDCKALTNYTKALLESQEIPSYYTVVFAKKRKDIDPDFTSIQGNHVILNIPEEGEDIWLECTNQTVPFDFIGDFTDDRNVLIVKPEGGEIKRTKRYEPEENILRTKATVELNDNASMTATVERISEGLEYDWRYRNQFETPKDQKAHYKENWGYINNIEINSIKFNDNKDVVKFTEQIVVSCANYTKKVGNRLLVTPNVFSCDQINLPQYTNRNTPLLISSGYVNTDEYDINLPEGYVVNNLPKKKVLETEFGKYTHELEKIDDSKIKFRRYLKIIDGMYPKEKYEEYRKFRSEIKKIDKSRIVLKKL